MDAKTGLKPNYNQKNLVEFLGYLFRHLIPRGKGILLNMAFPEGAFFDYDFTIINLGKPYAGNLKFGIDHNVFFFQFYEQYITQILQSAVKYLSSQQISTNFLDIGANVGSHSYFMVGFADSVHSFEPHPEIFGSLEAKWKALKNESFHIHKFGLGKEDCDRKYYQPTVYGWNSGTGSFVMDCNGNSKTPIVLPIREGDKVIAELGIDPVSLIKIDVEGFEPLVFQGLSQTLRRDRPIIITEISAMTRKVMSEQNCSLESLLYDNVALFEIHSINQRCKFSLEEKSFETLSDSHHDLLIVPREHTSGLLRQLQKI